MGLMDLGVRFCPDNIPVTWDRDIAEDNGVRDVDCDGPATGFVGVMGELPVIDCLTSLRSADVKAQR
jgi:hypothetical protein